MKILFLLILLPNLAFAQQVCNSTKQFRQEYKHNMLQDAHRPLDEKGIKLLRFFCPSDKYVFQTTFEPIVDNIGFDMQTHSGKIKKYFIFGKLHFNINNQAQQLYIYQSEKNKNSTNEAELFIPFTDFTNYKTTFGGGRYIDINKKDLEKEIYFLDFNKAYNPYCAYSDGYSCPIPPSENKLQFYIKAGEKIYHPN